MGLNFHRAAPPATVKARVEVKQHLDATRSEKTVMEEEFLQELARSVADL